MSPGGQRRLAIALVLTLLLGSAAALTVGIRAASLYLQKLPVDPPRPLAQVPPETESFIRLGEDQLVSPEIEETLGTSNYLTRTYLLKGSDPAVRLSLHAAYYTGMIDTVPHVPERCFVGAGMQMSSDAEVVRIPLDMGPRSRLRLEIDGYPASTPDAFRPVVNEDGTRDVYWYRLSNRYGSRKGEFVRVSFDPQSLRMRVSRFSDANGALLSGYFFLANGGITPSANGVRQLAFKLGDKSAYYMKVQFTSNDVQTPEELAALSGRFLDEALGELLLCAPDWIELRMSESSAH